MRSGTVRRWAFGGGAARQQVIEVSLCVHYGQAVGAVAAMAHVRLGAALLVETLRDMPVDNTVFAVCIVIAVVAVWWRLRGGRELLANV